MSYGTIKLIVLTNWFETNTGQLIKTKMATLLGIIMLLNCAIGNMRRGCIISEVYII